MRILPRYIFTALVTKIDIVYLDLVTVSNVVIADSTSTITTTTTTTATTTVPTVSTSFPEIMLSEHNKLRSLHGSQSLTWNETLVEYAQAYSNAYNCSGILTHSGGHYGENLAIGYTPINAVDAWYNESTTYNYSKQNTVYNHFTQLVWNNTSNLGCAYKYCNEVWGTYIICSYYPQGNVIGEETENVFPLLT